MINNFLIVAFKHVVPCDILSGKLPYKGMSKDNFTEILSEYMKQHTGVELNKRYSFLLQKLGSDKLDIFKLVFMVSEEMLVMQGNDICCSYEQLMRWRLATIELGEEIFTTAYLASNVSEKEVEKMGFSWRFVLGHDAQHLNELLKEGLAENHFHLLGSAPIFPVSWINLMNAPCKKEYRDALSQIDENKRTKHMGYSSDYQEEPLVKNCQLAALIRVFLYSWLTDTEIWIGKYIGLDTIEDYEEYHKTQMRMTMENVMGIITNISSLSHYNWDVANNIRNLGRENIDYMLKQVKQNKNDFFYAGERWFMYEMFRRIHTSTRQEDEVIFNLFYAYLVLKTRLYGELVHSNQRVGFDNFQIYQVRKGAFQNARLQKKSIQYAMYDCVVSGQLHTLEARISTVMSANKYAETIKKWDAMIDAGEKGKEKYFYVFHFLKREDKDELRDNEYRHMKFRKIVKKQSHALVYFRKKYPELATRVRGIDAASQEIGCRPEVFGTAFRYLQCDIRESIPDVPAVPKLRLTYHVGEEFLDIVDGLRAIEEAVHFLNLRQKDRIGHALALGLEVHTWYNRKDFSLVLPMQDCLDNLVWLYVKLNEFGIEDADAKDWILKKAKEYFQEIYSCNMSGKLKIDFDVNAYYQSWQIRGDHPSLYCKGYYEEPSEFFEAFDMQKVNRFYPDNGDIRYIPEVGRLYYLYHYDVNVRQEGNKEVLFDVNDKYIRAAEKVQRKMRFWVAEKGIAIETNPSSNYKISSMERYEEHPISLFYNEGLTSDENELQECPQLRVSINTDDQGIFATSLSNEYSLMASALEKKYSEDKISSWLENIKRMGNEQTFKGE